ncbi:MAG: GxxExxY protein [Chitinophagales bacterium]
MQELNKMTDTIIGCSIDIHKHLGPGLLESAYRECLFYDLKQNGLDVKREIPMPIIYKEIRLDQGYRMDLLVENKIVVELKTVDFLLDVHKAQLLTYLKLGNYKLGLLINFNETLLKDGIKRIIN